MSYSAMTDEELILLAMEFVGRDLNIPDEIKALLGPDLIGVIEPSETLQYDKVSERPRT